jgi:hypothetical protein
MPHGMNLIALLATRLGKSRFPAKKSRRESLEDFCFSLSPRNSALCQQMPRLISYSPVAKEVHFVCIEDAKITPK